MDGLEVEPELAVAIPAHRDGLGLILSHVGEVGIDGRPCDKRRYAKRLTTGYTGVTRLDRHGYPRREQVGTSRIESHSSRLSDDEDGHRNEKHSRGNCEAGLLDHPPLHDVSGREIPYPRRNVRQEQRKQVVGWRVRRSFEGVYCGRQPVSELRALLFDKPGYSSVVRKP
jgi:hypothetical protein